MGTCPFVHTFSEIWKMVNVPTKVKVTVYLLFFCFKFNNDWLRIHKLHQCKQFQMIFGEQVLLYV